jgi:hypothetical protein
MAGLIAQGQAYKALTDRGLAEVARADQERDMTNQQIKMQRTSNAVGNAMGGAGLAAAMGAGPVGIGAAALGGLLVSIL